MPADLHFLAAPQEPPAGFDADHPRLASAGYVEWMTGLREAQMVRLADAGRFPKPVRVHIPGRKAPENLWVRREITEWIAAALAARNAGSRAGG